MIPLLFDGTPDRIRTYSDSFVGWRAVHYTTGALMVAALGFEPTTPAYEAGMIPDFTMPQSRHKDSNLATEAYETQWVSTLSGLVDQAGFEPASATLRSLVYVTSKPIQAHCLSSSLR